MIVGPKLRTLVENLTRPERNAAARIEGVLAAFVWGLVCLAALMGALVALEVVLRGTH